MVEHGKHAKVAFARLGFTWTDEIDALKVNDLSEIQLTDGSEKARERYNFEIGQTLISKN